MIFYISKEGILAFKKNKITFSQYSIWILSFQSVLIPVEERGAQLQCSCRHALFCIQTYPGRLINAGGLWQTLLWNCAQHTEETESTQMHHAGRTRCLSHSTRDTAKTPPISGSLWSDKSPGQTRRWPVPPGKGKTCLTTSHCNPSLMIGHLTRKPHPNQKGFFKIS